ncbi:MAG: DUF4058 family protein, partial [Anaerolineae bacterium]|nr:DUF4058 family protein [Anaerolineae bacterium]
MVSHSPQNLFPGINPHLNSRLQQPGAWAGFHATHLGDLFKALRAALYPLRYTVRVEESIQIRRLGEPPRRLRADVIVLDTDPARAARPLSSILPGVAKQVAPVLDMLPDDELARYSALAIAPLEHPQGDPVAWLELLSPTNKPPAPDFAAYHHKRTALLKAGISFIELDYLHETPPALRRIVPYPQPGAQPYRITVLDPRPTLAQRTARSRLFGVCDPLPVMAIAL